jgi:hypothetical protein
METTAIWVGLLTLCASVHAADVLELELRLPGALRSGPTAKEPGPSLVVDLARTGDRWERVWAVESDNRRALLHTGRVRKADIAADHVVLDLAMEGPRVQRLRVDTSRAADGRLTGTYTAIAGGFTNAAAAEGRIKPARPPLPAGFVPLKPGEHPRILFRAADLPALRERAKTAMGQALVARMGAEKAFDAIGAGVLWHLTRDPAMAERAQRLAEAHMAEQGPGYSGRTSKGRHPEQVALAFDLCYDVWPVDFKAKVIEYLVKTVKTHLGRMPGNEHVCSNWNARAHAGAAFAMLALWGELGPMPLKPEGPEADSLLPFWEDDCADWKRLGEVNMEYQRLFERTRYLLYLFCREATGTGGFRGENAHYGLLAAEMSIEYAACYRRVFGADLSPYPDITWMVPRMLFGQDFSEAGGPLHPLDINGKNGIDGEFYAYGYSLVPDRWRETALWAWNLHLGVTGPDALAKKIAADTAVDASGVLVWLFLAYPLDAKQQPPAATMPLTWEAPDHGYYGFRSGWTGKGDFALQVHAKSHFTGGWSSPNAGTFRLHGRGQSWNDTSSERDAVVWQENRVMMPEESLNHMGQARVIFTDFRPDGSGSVTMDMSDTYGAVEGRLYTMYGNFRYASAFKDLGIHATRAVAVDYSGKSGAPCLFVLVDRIAGGKGKVWTWNLGDAAVVPKVAVAGNTVTIPKGAATLRGTFVTPATVEIKALVHEVPSPDPKTPPRKIPMLQTTGGDDFLFVATVQDAGAPAPEVKVEGSGLAAKITVGARRVTFEGDKVVIAEAR